MGNIQGVNVNLYNLDESWGAVDLIVIGGGVTGAGVFLEAVNRGWRTLLVEQKDFAWGTSSRSSKMVHGGLRYLKEGRLLQTRAAIQEREDLLKALPGLVDPLGFLVPVYANYGPSRRLMATGLSLYSLLALQKQHQAYGPKQMLVQIPQLKQQHLTGGFYFRDAQVDDARLVLRLINQGVANGGLALNYTAARDIRRDDKGRIAGVVVEDVETGGQKEIQAKAVINATGVWAEKLHPAPKNALHLRPLRGSHLIFPGKCFPGRHVISFLHPQDQRPIFLFPWEGCAILGTTDIDHDGNLDEPPVITEAEANYLMAGLRFIMPELPLSMADCIASMAGIRPVLGKGGVTASRESREHVVWRDRGLITVTGGKLTTFRLLAHDALKAAWAWLPRPQKKTKKGEPPAFDAPDPEILRETALSSAGQRRLAGRYGKAAETVVAHMADKNNPETIAGTGTLWAELSFAAENEQVRHLSDLMLRRTRIGLLCENGGREHLDRVQSVCQPFLGWDEARWESEKTAYLETWQKYYAPPTK